MNNEDIVLIIDKIKCPICGYENAEHQHEPGVTMGILYCPECEKRVVE